LSLRPRQIHEAVLAARAAQDTPDFKDRYRVRAGVEGTASRLAARASALGSGGATR
jgi:hypothetical protein